VSRTIKVEMRDALQFQLVIMMFMKIYDGEAGDVMEGAVANIKGQLDSEVLPSDTMEKAKDIGCDISAIRKEAHEYLDSFAPIIAFMKEHLPAKEEDDASKET